ncbi:hypothetical protein [Polaromonas aquatica]|uniref:hypothetical protein n=1 Tax=Polaromonas aquatica TaxID=332657 RepID=UPI003D662703
MKSKFFAGLILAMAFVAGPASARWPMPIVNYPDIPVVTSSGAVPSAARVKQAIQAGATAKNWTVAQQADGKLQATLKVRGKHTVIVQIAYTPEKYSLIYQDSIDMDYGQRNGEPVIHPFYNKWVADLKESIRGELVKI